MEDGPKLPWTNAVSRIGRRPEMYTLLGGVGNRCNVGLLKNLISSTLLVQQYNLAYISKVPLNRLNIHDLRTQQHPPVSLD